MRVLWLIVIITSGGLVFVQSKATLTPHVLVIKLQSDKTKCMLTQKCTEAIIAASPFTMTAWKSVDRIELGTGEWHAEVWRFATWKS